MKKRIILIFVIIASVFMVISGCDFIAKALVSVTGKVIDAKTGLGVDEVTVTLTYKGEDSGHKTTYMTTSGSDGSFAFSDADYGEYNLTAEKTGYVFIPKDVYVSGLAQSLGTVTGFLYDSSKDQYTISLILLWNDTFQDVDAYLTYPDDDKTSGTAPVLSTPYDTAGSVLIGFMPATSGREQIDYTTKTSVRTIDNVYGDGDTRSAVQLDVDDRDGTGPETISVRSFPFMDSANDLNTSGGGSTGLPAGNYTWIGVMEYYADAYSSVGSDTTSATDYLSNVGTGASADAVLYVMQGETLLGIYTVPTYTKVKTASLLRINMFYDANGEYYQIVPDLRVLQSTTEVKSLGNGDNGIIVVKGRTR